METLLTPAEAAQAFRVRPKTLARWANEGLIRCVRTPGGHRRYLAEEVAAFLSAPSAEERA